MEDLVDDTKKHSRSYGGRKANICQWLSRCLCMHKHRNWDAGIIQNCIQKRWIALMAREIYESKNHDARVLEKLRARKARQAQARRIRMKAETKVGLLNLSKHAHSIAKEIAEHFMARGHQAAQYVAIVSLKNGGLTMNFQKIKTRARAKNPPLQLDLFDPQHCIKKNEEV